MNIGKLNNHMIAPITLNLTEPTSNMKKNPNCEMEMQLKFICLNQILTITITF